MKLADIPIPEERKGSRTSLDKPSSDVSDSEQSYSSSGESSDHDGIADGEPPASKVEVADAHAKPDPKPEVLPHEEPVQEQALAMPDANGCQVGVGGSRGSDDGPKGPSASGSSPTSLVDGVSSTSAEVAPADAGP